MKLPGIITDAVREYLKGEIGLLKIVSLEKAVKVVTFVITLIIVFFTGAFVLICLAFLFSFWYMGFFENSYNGFLLSAGFFFLAALAVILLRRKLFTNNLIKLLQNILFSENEEDI